MAGGKAAVYAEKKSESKSMKIILGGIPPKERALISMQVII